MNNNIATWLGCILAAILVSTYFVMAIELFANLERVEIQTSSNESMYVNYKNDIYVLVPVDIAPLENKSE